MRRNAMRHIIEVATQAIEDSQGIGAIPVAERLYQFRILLKHSKPEVWRRIQVKRCTLDKLHEHIQTAMGWTNSHLHQFHINGERYGDPELLDDGFEDDVFTALCNQAIRKGLISTGRYAESLGISRREAMKHIEQEAIADVEVEVAYT